MIVRNMVSGRTFWIIVWIAMFQFVCGQYYRYQMVLWKAEAEYATALAIKCVNSTSNDVSP